MYDRVQMIPTRPVSGCLGGLGWGARGAEVGSSTRLLFFVITMLVVVVVVVVVVVFTVCWCHDLVVGV